MENSALIFLQLKAGALYDSATAVQPPPNVAHSLRPTWGKLTIDYLLLTIENVYVTDMAGKILLNNQYTINNNQYQIDLSILPDGLYFLHINTAQGIQRHKIILAR